MKKCIALTVLLVFGCATVRMPAGSVEDQVVPASGILAEPQVELWLESGGPVTQQETDEARQQARIALQQALDTRAIAPSPMGAADPVLVVRERGVSRTASRRRDQVGATIGLVVGIVVVVAVVVGLAIASKDSGSKATAPKSAPANASAPKPHAVPVPKPAPAPVRIPRVRPVPWPEPYPWLWVNLYYEVPPRPLILMSGDLGAPPPPEEEPEPAIEPPPLELPPPPQFDVNDRGFFSGDDTVLQIDLLDRATGKLLWTKTVQGGDPRDPGDVRRMVNDALDGASWAARTRVRASR